MLLGKTALLSFSGDITKISFVDAIVNPTNTKLQGDAGISKLIHKAAGSELKDACKMLKGCQPGQAKITDGYNLPCKYIIHTAGPSWKGDNPVESTKKLAECYRNVLYTAMKNNIHTIAFPSISTGYHGFPEQKAAHTAVHTVYSFIAKYPDSFEKIIWVLKYSTLKDIYDNEINALSPELFLKLKKSLSKAASLHEYSIEVADFVVHTSKFKCMHNGHKIVNIDGIVSIIDQNGNVKKIKVPAGYCASCKLYFILDSTYESLQNKGIPICKVLSSPSYLNEKTIAKDGMNLAEESILKQYGYTVAEHDGLTTAQRRKILSCLIDNGIISKTGVISYLDFFINAKKKLKIYDNAVNKWKSDRAFIVEYKIGSFKKVIVGSIHAKGTH